MRLNIIELYEHVYIAILREETLKLLFLMSSHFSIWS